MMFANPRALWLMLVTMSLLVVFLWWTWRKKQSLIRQFVHSRLFEQLTFGVSTKLQITRIVLVVIAVVFLFLAMARPQWGFTWEEATQRGRDIVVAIDTSRSMLARDIAPNRLERAKLAALDLLNLSKGDRLGLVTFAGTAFLQCPLTLDDEAFRQSVQILEAGIIPQGGTAIGEAIDAALTAFKENEGSNHKVIVLLTDGEDHDEQAITKVEKAAQSGARIFTVGVGTANGELLKIVDENGRETFLKDDMGNVVKSRLNEKLLQQIASSAHGFYLPLQGAGTMEKLYESGLAPLPTSEANSTLYKRYKEQFFWPLLVGLLLLVAELFVPERKRMKNGASKMQPAAMEKTKVVGAAVLLLVLLQASPVMASPSRAQKSYEAGNYKDALNDYKRLLKKRPEDPRLHYNAGAAAYRAKQYEEASQQFNAALLSPDLNLQQKAYYNLGNTEYRKGETEIDPTKKLETWKQSLKHFESALRLNQKDAGAEFNRNSVQKMIEQLEKQQKQQQKQKGDNKDNKDQQKQEKQEKQNQEQGKDNQDSQEQQKQNQDKKDQQQQDGKGEDQKKQNQEQNEKKDGQEQSSNDQPKPGEGEQNQEQQNASKDQDKDKNAKDQQAQNGKQDEQEQPGTEADQQAMSAALGKMTPAQARQLLDTQKGEEKAMIFLPQKGRNGKANRFKDW